MKINGISIGTTAAGRGLAPGLFLALWAMMAVISMPVRADDYPDDYGDDVNSRTAISPGGAPVNGQIEIDTDEDWFSFPAMQQIKYTISISTGTIWDCTLDLKAGDGVTTLVETNTAQGGSPASIVWSNSGAACTRYIRVSGFVEFTTGTYVLAVSSTFVDTDGDGMDDNWEIQQFTNLTNAASGDVDGDGQNNGQEYLMRTSPTQFSSGLFISDVARMTNRTQVTWPVVENGSYRVSSRTNLVQDQAWDLMGWKSNELFTGYDSLIDPSSLTNFPNRYYRVEFVY